ncbi:MAG TPA: Sua5/YciO/YrdC/YwlC family protein [Candidatus Methylomirabilis sp.]|nr:Sua5/YciO/YrdC/YwlC family protein [Candidatus Methylomirabilis sp.]
MTGQLIQAARILKNGGVVAYATEYCFGFGCDPKNRVAVLRLLRLKRRPLAKGLIIIAADTAQLAPYVQDIPAPVLATWPGPHTWLLEARADVPAWITGDHPRIAVRVTAHPQAAALCRAAGMALVSTSANRAGSAPVRRFRDALRRFKGEVDYVLPGMVGDAPAPTPIRDAVTRELIRPG